MTSPATQAFEPAAPSAPTPAPDRGLDAVTWAAVGLTGLYFALCAAKVVLSFRLTSTLVDGWTNPSATGNARIDSAEASMRTLGTLLTFALYLHLAGCVLFFRRVHSAVMAKGLESSGTVRPWMSAVFVLDVVVIVGSSLLLPRPTDVSGDAPATAIALFRHNGLLTEIPYAVRAVVLAVLIAAAVLIRRRVAAAPSAAQAA